MAEKSNTLFLNEDSDDYVLDSETVPSALCPIGSNLYVRTSWPSGHRSFSEGETKRGTKLIRTDEHGEVVAALGEAKRIATFGLGGCTAVAVASEFPDGSRRAYLQHYSPVEKLASAQALEKALTPTGINEPSKTQVVIVSPCNYAKDTTGKFVLKPTSFLLINLLESTSLHYLGAEADVQVHSYWVGEESNLAIELGATGETNIVVESLFD